MYKNEAIQLEFEQVKKKRFKGVRSTKQILLPPFSKRPPVNCYIWSGELCQDPIRIKHNKNKQDHINVYKVGKSTLYAHVRKFTKKKIMRVY